MKIQESAEMYLENILVLRERQGTVRSIDIVELSGYSKPSISRAVGLLKDGGLIAVDRDGLITLTQEGEARAQKIYERHRLLTRFFEAIGVDKDTAAEDACKAEHVLSNQTFAKLKAHADRLLS